ncbi:His Kinase A domain containing protein [Linnemannia zychae]|nr:His Kinase A domain containing protein [Linnemannia zychae]
MTDSPRPLCSRSQTFHWFLDAQHVEEVTPNPSISSLQHDRSQSETAGLPNQDFNKLLPGSKSDTLRSVNADLVAHKINPEQPTHSDTKIRSRLRSASLSASTTLSTAPTSLQPTINVVERFSMLAILDHDKSSTAVTGLSHTPIDPTNPTSSNNKRIPPKGYQRAKSYPSQSHKQPPTHCTTTKPDCESCDDFLKAYSQGHLGLYLPPFPAYARALAHSFPPPLPPNEERRLRSLYSFQILETGTDLNFDRIAQLVGTVLGVSGCMICLVDQENVAIKANYQAANMECRRDISLSGHAILRAPDDPLVILDATKDWRFNGLPAVRGGPLVRFYAGAALATPDGYNVGSLCVIDPKPRATFTEKERLLLVDFAAVVMREMTLWKDQVNLCTKTRMMRDITCWVRACLDMAEGDSLLMPKDDSEPEFVRRVSFDDSSERLTPPPDEEQTAEVGAARSPVQCIHDSSTSLPNASILLTPNCSPTFQKEWKASDRSTHLGNIRGTVREKSVTGDRLRDKAFPSACNMIQETLGADAVYLVQVEPNKSFLPQAGSGVSWNLWNSTTQTKKGAVGIVSSAEPSMDFPGLALECLASSVPLVIDEPVRNARRQGTTWVCAEAGCRPHRIRDFRQDMAEPDWERDLPVISEAVCYVRQLKSAPARQSGDCPLYTCCPGSEENNWFEPTRSPGCPSSTPADDSAHSGLLCHTFQGTLPAFEIGSDCPYKSCVVMPIRGASSADHTGLKADEPWAYIVVLTSSVTKQFLQHERIYLRNFGSCLFTEVMKQKIEAADEAKGNFIKNISHELRTPLHIILGIIELLQANTEETLTEQQLTMLGSAEASGKGLINTINNIIDLADLDPNNHTDVARGRKQLSDLFANVSEVDIRGLCEEVAASMAKRCVGKSLIINSSWPKSTMTSLSSSAPSTSAGAVMERALSNQTLPLLVRHASEEEPAYDYSLVESLAEVTGSSLWADDHKPSLELLVAVDEPEETPEDDIHWNFMLNLPMVKRILTQLLENAIKFTTTGFVEISAFSPPLSMFPLKPPQPDSRPIMFTVRDTGKGISPEYIQAHLFERFSQEDPLQAGTGLGLALVKLLVESLGGWLEVRSEGVEGNGCVVRVLIWATPSPATVERSAMRSLKDEEGSWRGKSCRFYAGDDEGSSVGSDRLWTVVGERMMGQELGMVVERGCEQDDLSPLEMFKNLKDHSSCDLLVFNDDLGRLKAYLSYWRDQHQQESDFQDTIMPPPVLMLTTVNKEKKTRAIVESYLKAWRGERFVSGLSDQPAIRVVIAPKPIGPLKLVQALRECFSDVSMFRKNSNDLGHTGTSTATTPLCEQGPLAEFGLFRSMGSVTSPRMTTLGMMDKAQYNNKQFPAGLGTISSPFKFPNSSSFLTPGTSPTVGVGVGVGSGYFDMAFGSYPSRGLVLADSRRPAQDKDKDVDENGGDAIEAMEVSEAAWKQALKMSSQNSGAETGRDDLLLGEILQTPSQPASPLPHPGQQVPQQRQGEGGEIQEQEQEQCQDQGKSDARSKSRRTIRNFMGTGYHHVGSSQGESRKLNAGPPRNAAATTINSEDDASVRPFFLRTRRHTTFTSNHVIPACKSNSSCGKNGNKVADSFSWSNLRVLIVEDNVTNRMILRTFFKKKGVTVVEAENGQAGVDRFEEELSRSHGSGGGEGGFDFVLMDLQMPVMDGNMATKRIREAERRVIKTVGLSARAAATAEAVLATAGTAASATTADGTGIEGSMSASSFASRIGGGGVTVVEEGGYRPAMIFALTGLAGDEDKRLAFECGVDGYLTKPVSLKGLAALLVSCHLAP